MGAFEVEGQPFFNSPPNPFPPQGHFKKFIRFLHLSDPRHWVCAVPLGQHRFAWLDSLHKSPEVYTTQELLAKLDQLRTLRAAELYLCRTQTATEDAAGPG